MASVLASPRISTLRFMTCGSVDDGKSTLMGRLLYETQELYDDQIDALVSDSKKVGTQGDALDFALLLDGLSAEREQGITIDVAYRFFSTGKRNFIVADTPGHEQYTRNMATGASTSDAAIILIDARKGLLPQTRRHSYLVSLLGIRHIALAINKMDLVGYAHEVFDSVVETYQRFATQIGIDTFTPIALSALEGDNVVSPRGNMPWYRGPTLIHYLESLSLDEPSPERPFRFLVQWVNRPNSDFRGYAGSIASGTIHAGDRVRIFPSGKESSIARIVTMDGDLPQAGSGQPITLTLDDELDVSRGDWIVSTRSHITVANQLQATLLWFDETPLLPGRSYLLKLGTTTVTASVSSLKHKVSIHTLEHLAANQLEQNDIGVCNIALDRAVPFDTYADHRETGSFILIDRVTHNTVGAGLIRFALRRAETVSWQALDINKAARAKQKRQQPCVLWFTGLSGAGKSTIANVLEQTLFDLDTHTYLIDGDNVRHGINKDLGFTIVDRIENIRRVAEIAKLMVDAGLVVLVSLISPFRAERQMARDLFQPEEFIEVFVDTPLAEAERRDTKGLYKKARGGAIKNFTGIDSPYEPPEHPELHLETATLSVEQSVERILKELYRRKIIP